MDAGEDSESESESSSSSSSRPTRTKDISEELESFRLQWKSELQKQKGTSTDVNDNAGFTGSATGPLNEVKTNAKGCNNSDDASNATVKSDITPSSTSPLLTVEEQAKHWFLQGVGLERKGDLYDAVKCYRRAIQLVPDIEYRISTAPPGPGNASEMSSSVGSPEDSDNEDDTDIDEEVEDDEGPLIEKLLKIIKGRGWVFFQKARQDNKFHLNDLPVEVLSYILRYILVLNL